MLATFRPFSTNEWIFESHHVKQIIELLNEEEKDMFYLDVSHINWENYLLTYNWGLHKYILNENIESPVSNNKDIL